MLSSLRQQFNNAFSEAAYEKVVSALGRNYNVRQELPTFKVSETPIFLTPDLKRQLVEAVAQVCDVLVQPDFKAQSERAILESQRVPNEDAHSLFMQLDFGICDDGNGGLIPQMIELQGFPSLYFFQYALAQAYREEYDTVPPHYTNFFNGYTSESYLALLRRTIVGTHQPENVVLLEIEPEKQNTRIDFWYTEYFLGIKILCLTNVRREGRHLYYEEGGKKIPIHRIYNRVIFDELLKRTDLPLAFTLTEDVEVEWAGHPNWFMRISKYTLPFLKNKYVPPTYFLHELEKYPEDLENYVLKPIYSFSGMGVKIHVTKADLDEITDDRQNYILQRKVAYAPVVPTLDEPAKCEVRMMLIWEPGQPRPTLVNNLVRMSKGEMVGVRYNKNKTWVGGSVAFFAP